MQPGFIQRDHGQLEPVSLLAQPACCGNPYIGEGYFRGRAGPKPEKLLGLFERTPRFVKRYADIASTIGEAAATYAAEVRARAFPGKDQLYGDRPAS